MRGPLALVVSDGVTERHVTRRTSGLRFKRSAYGGDVDLTCAMRLARGTFTNLGANDPVRAYDARSGAVMFSGDVSNPGATVGPSGESYQLQALGTAARLQAHAKAQAYVLTGEGGFNFQESGGPKGVQTDVRERDSDGEPRYLSWANEGKNVYTNWRGDWVNRQLQRIGRRLGRVDFTIDAGLTNGGYQWQLWVGPDSDNMARVDVAPVTTSASTLSRGFDTGQIRAQDDTVMLRIVRTGVARTAADEDWFRFTNPILMQRRKNPDGTSVQTGYGPTHNYVTASDVIADMVGDGMFPGADPAKVTIAEFDYQIDTLAWLDGITMGDALEQLRSFHPDLWWRAEGDRFTAGVWDDENPRYSITKRDGGITLPGQEITLCNRVLVSWKDKRGKDRVTEVTAVVPGLDYTRDADPVTLPEGAGSEANALRAGQKALTMTNRPPKAGTAVIRRPVRDNYLGCDVSPHEVLPGHTVLEQETGDTYRLTEVEYVDDDGAASLTLGEPRLTQEQFMARLARRQRRRR